MIDVGEPRFKIPPLTWTRSQRRVLLALLTVLLVFLAGRYVRNPRHVTDPQPQRPPRSHELADRINPNTADWPALAALPGIGEKRAKDIVAFREEAKRYAPTSVVFKRPQDMLKVPGIGVAMLEGIAPHLEFSEPATAPASAPVFLP